MEKNNDVSGCSGCGGSNGLDRRAFLSMTVLATAGAALAACGGADITAPAAVDATIKIAEHPELANVGGVATFSLNGTPVAVVRSTATTFVVLSRICTHQGSTVNSNGNGFTCPNHGAMFNKTGGWVGGQVTTNLRTYPVTFNEAANTLTVG